MVILGNSTMVEFSMFVLSFIYKPNLLGKKTNSPAFVPCWKNEISKNWKLPMIET
jgi:hypothetical protein